jgi:protein-S-isoprenylcysteine O-methyltransferase Ste14
MSRFTKWAGREYSERQRMLALFVLGTLFVIAIPLTIFYFSSYIDRYFQLLRFSYGIPNITAGILLIISGLIFALWSIYAQFTIGRGTPAPMMPTHKLIICKPFSYCRNPMTFGTVLLYMGIAIWIGSFSAVSLVVLLGTILAAYLKLTEEKELLERYGAEYLEYKKKTPFLLPRLWK